MKLSTFAPLRGAALSLVGLAPLALPAAAQSIHAEVWGSQPNSRFGRALTVIGDLDHDGYPEYLVGAPEEQTGASMKPGAAYVISGRWHYPLREHRDGTHNSQGGAALAAGPDVNGDGYPDYAIAYPRATVNGAANTGIVRMYSGKDGSILSSFFGPQGGWFGAGIAFVGDLDGDGVQDLAVGAPNYVHPDGPYGMIRVFSGATGMQIRQWIGYADMLAEFGAVIQPAGDWNGDGVPDVLVGLPGFDGFGELGVMGAAAVLSGTTGSPLHTWYGTHHQSGFGRAVATLPDMDGDGRREILVGAHSESGLGVVRLFSSSSKQALLTLSGQAPDASFGSAVCAVGDVDGDGVHDFAVGSYWQGPEALRIFSGKSGKTLWQPLLTGPGQNFLGISVAPMGDADGDGWLDLLVGDSRATMSGIEWGAAYVVRAALHQPNLGSQGPGNSKLSVHGKPLSLGGWADLELKTAGTNRPGVLVASPFMNPTPIFGGTLVPTLDALLIPYVTDVNGKFHLKGIPGGLGLFSIYCQAVTKNPNVPQGWGFSNAVRVDFAP